MKKIKKEILRKRTRIAHKRYKNECKRKKRKIRNTVKIVKKRDKRIVLASEFNFSSNYEETVESLIKLKNVTCLNKNKSNFRKRNSNVYIDLTSVKSLSVAGALVLAAEIDRWRKLESIPLKPRELKKWDPNVKSLLYSLGFFELLGVKPPEIPTKFANSQNFVVLKLKSFKSFKELEGEEVMELINEIQMNQIGTINKKFTKMYGALFEALDNSRIHAYPEDWNFKYEHVNEFWCTASWRIEKSAFQFLVYDQGIGIPASLPKSYFHEQIRAYLSRILGKTFNFGSSLSDESLLIEASIDVSRTSKNEGHGKGLRNVIEPINRWKDSKVRIFSGKGSYAYNYDKSVEKLDHRSHIGGTLIEWTIPFE